eukprot:8541174-Pyramimonas_sp.AAC.1
MLLAMCAAVPWLNAKLSNVRQSKPDVLQELQVSACQRQRVLPESATSMANSIVLLPLESGH